MAIQHKSEKLPLRVKLIFAVGQFAITTLLSTMGFFLLIFYTDVLHIRPAVAGTALLFARIWDTVNDPLFGYWSDRTRSRFGRRRVFLIWGAVPLAITTATLWLTPSDLSPLQAFIWILVTFVLFDTFFTLVQVPMTALGAELTTDYDERTSLLAIASIGGVSGYIIGSVGMPAIVGSFAADSAGYAVTGAILGVFAGAAVGLVAWKLPDPRRAQTDITPMQFLESAKTALKNHPFVRLILILGLVRIGFTFVQTTMAYYLTYQLEVADSISMVMGTFMLAVGLFIYFWKQVSNRTSKSIAYACGLGLGVVALFCLGLAVPKGAFLWGVGLVALMGCGLSTHWVMPWSMLPDVIEIDQVTSGQRREGIYVGLAGVVDKLARAITIFATGLILDFYGYVGGVEPTEGALFAIRMLVGPIPAVVILLALPLLFYYPITRASHAELIGELERKGK